MRSLYPIRSLHRALFASDTLLHDEYYDKAYFENDVMKSGAMAAPIIARYAKDHLEFADVLDVGCGTGEYLEAFGAEGADAYGVELADAALRQCHARGLTVQRFDLTGPHEFPWQTDLVMSIEVAEHLPEIAATIFASKLAKAAKRTVVLTAAQPGQPGLGHINCQPKQYWIDKFTSLGLKFDQPFTRTWQEYNQQHQLPGWWCRNLMVFHKA